MDEVVKQVDGEDRRNGGRTGAGGVVVQVAETGGIIKGSAQRSSVIGVRTMDIFHETVWSRLEVESKRMPEIRLVV